MGKSVRDKIYGKKIVAEQKRRKTNKSGEIIIRFEQKKTGLYIFYTKSSNLQSCVC